MIQKEDKSDSSSNLIYIIGLHFKAYSKISNIINSFIYDSKEKIDKDYKMIAKKTHRKNKSNANSF